MRIGDAVQSKWMRETFIGVVLSVGRPGEIWVLWIDGTTNWMYAEDLEVIYESG